MSAKNAMVLPRVYIRQNFHQMIDILDIELLKNNIIVHKYLELFLQEND